MTWPKEATYLGGEGVPGVRPQIPEPKVGDLAEMLIGYPRLWSPDQGKRWLIATPYTLVSLAMDRQNIVAEFGDLTGSEAGLYQAMYRIPTGELGVGLDRVEEPRELIQIGVKLAIIGAQVDTLPRMPPGEFRRAAQLAADAGTWAVMRTYDELLGPQPSVEARRFGLGH
jgi:hypothetical protein